MRSLAWLLILVGVACEAAHPAPPSVLATVDGAADAGDADAIARDGDTSPTPPTEVTTDAPPPPPTVPAVCAMVGSEKVERAILEAPPRSGGRAVRYRTSGAPLYLDHVADRFALTGDERARLDKNGFVVPARLTMPTYADAFHEVYQSELPLYVGADAIFHAVFVTEDELVADLEERSLDPVTDRVLARMHGALAAAAGDYPAEAAADLDVYLAVARSLLSGQRVATVLRKGDADVRAMLDAIAKADAMTEVELFGRRRIVDFSQYVPRGHYVKSARTRQYFKASMWLSRLELNVVSRSSRSSQPGLAPDPDETPREALTALAMADLADRSGAMADVERLDRAWSLLAGRREDLSLGELSKLRKKAQIARVDAAAFAPLKQAIGADYRRTARLHYMPPGSTELPAIATLLGPRVVADAFAMRPLTHGETPDRFVLSAGDVGYALGHDRAKAYIEGDLARFPTLSAQLEKARAIASAPVTGTDLYGAWYGAIRALSEKPTGALPSFTDTEAFSDLRLGSALVAYGQLKHNFVLIAGQPYEEGACNIPDGYVEPVPAVYAWLAEYAHRGAAVADELAPRSWAAGYFRRLERIAGVLRVIARDELAGLPLTADQLRFVAMTTEIHIDDIGTGFATEFNGWYFDLFSHRPAMTVSGSAAPDEPSFKDASFIADFATSSNAGQVSYLGARPPRLGVFLVDTGGAPRAMVGPVARGFEHHGPLAQRLDDGAGRKLTQLEEPWSKSYTVEPAPEPPLLLRGSFDFLDEVSTHRSSPGQITLRSTRNLGPVTVELLDHHRKVTASLQKDVGPKTVVFSFASRPAKVEQGTHATEGIRVRVGEYTYEQSIFFARGVTSTALGGMPKPTW
ncbi:MAG: DUF3160 domain-containing protein [Polyangiaceae bacterium]|nr:DUF3160 domain-containing protein [Polyangiaceae bacterium]